MVGPETCQAHSQPNYLQVLPGKHDTSASLLAVTSDSASHVINSVFKTTAAAVASIKISEFCACRYTVEEAVELLKLIGFRNTDVVEAHGITGGDLLELNEHELRDELKLPRLQVQLLVHSLILTCVD